MQSRDIVERLRDWILTFASDPATAWSQVADEDVAQLMVAGKAGRYLREHREDQCHSDVVLLAQEVKKGLHDIPHYEMKGAALSQYLYGRPDLRGHGDVDILIPASSAMEAHHRLRGLGFHQEVPIIGNFHNELFPSDADIPVWKASGRLLCDYTREVSGRTDFVELHCSVPPVTKERTVDLFRDDSIISNELLTPVIFLLDKYRDFKSGHEYCLRDFVDVARIIQVVRSEDKWRDLITLSELLRCEQPVLDVTSCVEGLLSGNFQTGSVRAFPWIQIETAAGLQSGGHGLVDYLDKANSSRFGGSGRENPFGDAMPALETKFDAKGLAIQFGDTKNLWDIWQIDIEFLRDFDDVVGHCLVEIDNLANAMRISSGNHLLYNSNGSPLEGCCINSEYMSEVVSAGAVAARVRVQTADVTFPNFITTRDVAGSGTLFSML